MNKPRKIYKFMVFDDFLVMEGAKLQADEDQAKPKRQHAPRPTSKASSSGEATVYVTLDDVERAKPQYGRQDKEAMRADAIYLGQEEEADKYSIREDDGNDERWKTLLPGTPTRSTPTRHYVVIMLLLVVFFVLTMTAGLRCAASGTCSTNKVPSLFILVYSMETSLLITSALCCLIGMHFVLTWALLHLLKEHSKYINILLILTSFIMYALVYVALIVPQWFITFIPMSVMALWAVLAMVGLRFFFAAHDAKKMFYISFLLCVVYAVSVVLYIAFSAVPYEFVPGKDIAILVLEITMAASLVVFSLSLLYHISGVSFTVNVPSWKVN